MSKGVNKVFLLGTVGREPEIRSTSGGSTVASLSLATNDRTKKDGEWVDSVEWHSLVAFSRTAEIIRDFVKKGSQLFIEGKITTRSWEDKTSGEKKYRTEILVNELSLLGGKSDSPDNGKRTPPPTKAVTNEDPFADAEITNDDLPDF